MTHYDDMVVENENLKHEVEMLRKQLQIAELNAEIERKKREKAEAQASARSQHPWATWTSSSSTPITIQGDAKKILDQLDQTYRSLNYKGKHGQREA